MSNDKAFKVKNGLELAGYDTSKAVTAVDVFVYDTSRDSDGGAWRKRTQHTSWYNETLDTPTRGSRKEFPAVAVIVAESDTVTIYDGDDPSLPMWMVFNEGTANYIYSNGDALTSVNASNGMLVVGTFRLQVINFVSDSGWKSEDSWYYYSVKPISSRNDTNTTAYNNTGLRIVNPNVNDVAMTVLPNAPIDAATGLPVPTIAVATDGGVSVIKDDGTVVDLTYTASTSNEAGGVWFPASGGIAWQSRSAAGGYVYTLVENEIPTADKSTASDALYANFGQAGFAGNDLVTLGLSQPREFVDGVIGSPNGLTHLDENPTTPANGMVAYTTTDYATGYMVGDIKLATLSDTTAGTVPTTDFVVNGTFATDTGWSKQTGWTIGSGVASCNGTNGAYLYQLSGLPADTQVVASIEITSYTSGSIRIGAAGASTTTVLDSVGTHLVSFTTSSAGGGTEILSISFVGSVDNVSVTAAVEDRSVNGNGLQVNGTITKTVVETGADLVAYSGFSASNYLEQPYNADLDFGTGDFSVMGWVKLTGAALQFLVYRGTASASSFDIYVGSAYDITFRTPTKTLNVPSFTTVNTWAFCTCVRRNGFGYIYRNGELIGSNTDFGDSVTLADAYTRIGYRNDYPATYGNMALWRISATAPSAAQIAKIYEDEKFLFQENAQATLYGASDAVTALAHDPITGILHAGTSQGRSDFAGLRRVNNTTTAVGVSISAVDGLIVED
jgi:trimeric autotransporter adhesin